MFKTVSKGGVGTIGLFISFALVLLGVDVEQTQIDEIALAAFNVMSFIMVVVGQIDRDDLAWGVFRKEPRDYDVE